MPDAQHTPIVGRLRAEIEVEDHYDTKQAAVLRDAAEIIGDLTEALEWAVNHFDGRTRENAAQLDNCIDMCRIAISRARNTDGGE